MRHGKWITANNYHNAQVHSSLHYWIICSSRLMSANESINRPSSSNCHQHTKRFSIKPTALRYKQRHDSKAVYWPKHSITMLLITHFTPMYTDKLFRLAIVTDYSGHDNLYRAPWSVQWYPTDRWHFIRCVVTRCFFNQSVYNRLLTARVSAPIWG